MRDVLTAALVRAPERAFIGALGQETDAAPIDLARALAQHAAYVEALGALGLSVFELPPLAGFADACFVEDTAVIFRDTALLTRPGAPSRRGEVDTVAHALRELGLRVTRMVEPATLDGGDVMRVGATFYVGRSARTNHGGVEALRAFAAQVGARLVVVDLPPLVLHLKCHASPLDATTVLAVEGLPLDLAPGVRRLDIPRAEAFAANAVAAGGDVLLAAGHPATAELVAAAGYRVHTVDTGEFAKADGSLTCLSLLC